MNRRIGSKTPMIYGNSSVIVVTNLCLRSARGPSPQAAVVLGNSQEVTAVFRPLPNLASKVISNKERQK